MNHSTPGLPVHHQLSEFTQTHVHRVSDAIQPSHPLSSPSPPGPNSSQHQSLFQWVNSSHEVATILEFQLQHHSLQRYPRADLQNGLVGSPCSPRDSQESSATPQFKSINSSALSFLHIAMCGFTSLLRQWDELIKHIQTCKQWNSVDYGMDMNSENVLLNLWLLEERRGRERRGKMLGGPRQKAIASNWHHLRLWNKLWWWGVTSEN